MAILATRRRWLVTSRRAASGSPCSFRRLANMNSSSGVRSGNLRISLKYRESPASLERAGRPRLLMLSPQFRASRMVTPSAGLRTRNAPLDEGNGSSSTIFQAAQGIHQTRKIGGPGGLETHGLVQAGMLES